MPEVGGRRVAQQLQRVVSAQAKVQEAARSAAVELAAERAGLEPEPPAPAAEGPARRRAKVPGAGA